MSFKGNIIQPTKVFRTDDGSTKTGQDDAIEFAGPDGTGHATNPQDLGKAKAYPVKQKAYLDTSEWGITREAAFTRLNG